MEQRSAPPVSSFRRRADGSRGALVTALGLSFTPMTANNTVNSHIRVLLVELMTFPEAAAVQPNLFSLRFDRCQK